MISNSRLIVVTSNLADGIRIVAKEPANLLPDADRM
jgi:hypothetical protein